MQETYHHRHLPCGVELAALPLSGRHVVQIDIRVLSGMIDEPEEKLGLAYLVEQTLDKGTAKRSARELSDAFDRLGAQTSSGVGRESFLFRCTCLPELLPQVLELYAEMFRTPAFPQEYTDVAIDLSRQELTALEDDPGELARKFISPHVYGTRLGRHNLGERETLDRISREDLIRFWQENFSARRLQVCLGGKVDADRAAADIDRLFAGFDQGVEGGRKPCRVDFSPGLRHHEKKLEQQHVLVAWPGVAVSDADYPVERVMLAILGDGMSSRLFTEVREKQGLVYWVGAWGEHPRAAGMIFIGASTTPARCDQTYRTVLRETDRLAETITDDELRRAKIGILARTLTHGDITRARVGELSSDLFHHGRPVPTDEKNAKIEAVSIDDVRRYLTGHPRDRLCVLTLGPRPMEGATT